MEAEQEARTLGWVPQEEFRGNPDNWVDAQTYVDRGKAIMPILRENNRRLEGEVDKLKGLYEASQEAIQELQKVHSDATKAAVEKARKDLLAELKQAKQDGDTDREVELTDQLTSLKAQEQAPAKAEAPPAPAIHPEFAAWAKENPWFGTDTRRTLRAQGIAQELRADEAYDSLVGKAFFDKVVEVMHERSQVGGSKVSSGRPTSGGGGGRSFSDLPADAKEACDRQGKKLVGDGRAFKDQAAWRTYYTNLYFQGESA